MKRALLILIAFNICFISKAQWVESSCDAPDSIKNLYLEDAKRLAVRLYPNCGIIIPEYIYHPILNLLLAVYNAGDLPARDLVVNTYNIHTLPRPVMHEMLIKVDTSYNWVKQWEKGENLTGNPDIDTLMIKYDLELKHFYNWRIGQYVLIRAINALNLDPLIKLFSSIKGVLIAGPNSALGDGNDIEFDGYRLIYSYGSGDCPAGCIGRTYWAFQVSPGCSVSYAGSWSYPLIVDAGKDTSICYGSSVNLNVSASNGAEPYTMFWNTGDTGPSITVNPLNSTTYFVTVTDAYGRIAIDEVSVDVYSLPPIDLGADTAICKVDTITLNAGDGFKNYKWNNGSENQTLNVNTSGEYHVTVTDENNCSNSDTIKITVHQLPLVDLGRDTAFCEGNNIILDAGDNFIEYSWNNGSRNQTLIVNQSGKYYVVVKDENTCSNSDTIKITVHQLPLVDLGRDTTICINDEITLNAGSNYSVYQWNNDSTNQTYTINGSFVGIGEHKYSVTVTDKNNCSNSDTITIIVKNMIGSIEKTSESPVIKLYPNPTNSIINIDFVSKNQTKISLSIVNIEGKVIYSKDFEININHFTEILDLSNFPKGLYFIKFQDDTFFELKKVILF